MKKHINKAMKKFFTQCGMLVIGLMLSASASAIETITYFHNDIVGSPLVATDQNGNVVWKESYHPYGEQLQKQAASANNHLWFADKSFEQTTGLSYSGARYYDSMLGRFMGMDPKGFDETNIQSFNRYAYANNNPYRFIDPDGRDSEFVNGYIAGVHNSISGPNSHAAEIRTGSFTFKFGAFIGMELTPLGILASGEAAGGAIATRNSAVNTESSASGTIRGTNKSGELTSRGSFRKGTLDSAWENAEPGPSGGRLCPTCQREVTVPPNSGTPRDWDGSHNPSWTNREFPANATRKQVLDNYNTGVSLECPSCNRSGQANDSRFGSN
jgi:RHS repeat-associated protein